jgi:hypothetical protein
MRRPVAVAAIAMTVAGCTSSEPGTPRAEPGSPSTSVFEPTTTPQVVRPRDLDLTGITPCELLTQQQLAVFAIDRPLNAGTQGGASVLAGSPDCIGRSSEWEWSFGIVASTKMGLQEYLSKTRADRPRTELTVDGYRAVQQEGLTSAPERGSGECYVDVDVADGQLLSVKFSQLGADPDKRLPIDKICAKATEVAEAALTTLQGG